ncbi:MAG: hypothetical protein O2943_03545 [Actinomycetota bacterium]|nr:hypothetical protein [Actinomycetota bacterium]
MRRLFWTAVGAAGGVVLYRQGQKFLAGAREQGVVASAQQVGLSAATTLAAARTLLAGAQRSVPTTAPGKAASRVRR